jgi:uncharacterized repeat protein (TIGR01451 family)
MFAAMLAGLAAALQPAAPACAASPRVVPPAALTVGTPEAPPPYDPAISGRGAPQNAVPGETAVWTLSISNPYSTTLADVVISDPIPGMFDIVDVNTPVGAAEVGGQVVTVVVSSLAPGQSFDVTITTVANDLAIAGDVCNVAYAGSNQAEACITMFPGLLPETGGQPLENRVLYGIAAAVATVGAVGGAFVLVRRRRTITE